MIAYGPSQVKPPAVQMLFHYWPNLKPPGAISEYRGLQYTGKKRIPCDAPSLFLPGHIWLTYLYIILSCRITFTLDIVVSPF